MNFHMYLVKQRKKGEKPVDDEARDPTELSDFTVFHRRKAIVRDRGGVVAVQKRAGSHRRIREKPSRPRGADDEEKERRTKDGEEEKGGRSYVSPPPEVGGPRNRLHGRSAIRPTVSVRVPDVRLSRLASASASSNPWTNLCG